jgi:hypothetical protein
MPTQYVVPLLCVAAIVFACAGPHRGSAELAASAASAAQHMQRQKGRSPAEQQTTPLASSLEVTVEDGVRLALRVTNKTDKQLELNFPSGQIYDFAVVDSAGRELWRWSADRMFTQSLQNRLLDAGETVTYEERWPTSGARGAFVAVATLRSSDHPLESRVEFTLP